MYKHRDMDEYAISDISDQTTLPQFDNYAKVRFTDVIDTDTIDVSETEFNL